MKKSGTRNGKAEAEAAILLLYKKSQEFKRIEQRYEEIKQNCYSVLSSYFGKNKIREYEVGTSTGSIKTSQVTKTSISFDCDKLEKALGKSLASQVIEKRYEIEDMESLVKYLKSCSVDPRIFKSFIRVEKTVNASELERLEEIGAFDAQDIEGCYTVTKGNPYYRLKASE